MAEELRDEQTTWSGEKVWYLDWICELEVAVTARAEARARAQPADDPSSDPQRDRVLMEMLADI